MADPNTQQANHRAPHTDIQILLFVVILCFTCAFLLAVVAAFLRSPQEIAKAFDQSKQMLIAAKVLNTAGYFEILDKDKKAAPSETPSAVPAEYDPEKKILVSVKAGEKPPQAADDQIKEVADLRIRPLVTDNEGSVFTLEDQNITLPEYLEENQKAGYANLPLKLFYAILENEEGIDQISTADVAQDLSRVSVYVIPVSGFGLWGPIYGYLAIGADGDKVIGTTWYDQGETPGLGANISEAPWQKQFFSKLIFQEPPSGETDFQTTGMGIIVVKGKVQNVYGNTPLSNSAVDGIAGATLTGNGVTAAYHDSLTPYREFFIKVQEAQVQEAQKTEGT